MNRRQIQSLLFSGRTLKPDLFEFRADRGVFEDAGTDPAENSDPVYQWNDQGPFSRFATQATLANRPTLSSSGVPNYLSFDGSDDRMTFGTTALATSSSAWSFEAYVQLTDFASNPYPHILTVQTNTTDAYDIAMSNVAGYLGLHIGSATTWARLKTDTAAVALTGSDKHVVVTYNGLGAGTAANFCVYLDGVKQALTTVAAAYGSTTNTASTIGATLGGANHWKGRIYRAAGFSRELTQAQVHARFTLGR